MTSSRGFDFGPAAASSPLSAKDQPPTNSGSASHAGNTLGSSVNGNSDMDGVVEDDGGITLEYLEPSSYPQNGKARWKDSGRTMAVAANPVGGEVAAWATKRTGSDPNKAPTLNPAAMSISDKFIFFSSPRTLPDPLINLYAETYTLFASLQRIVAASFRLPSPGLNDALDSKAQLMEIEGMLGPPGAETVGHMARLVGMYLEEVNKLREDPDADPAIRSRFNAVYHVLHLAEILFLPRDGRGEGLLGEELLDWVNDVDPAPDNTLGNEIMQCSPSWDHPSFWAYLSRCLLRGFHLPASTFLRSLIDHSHPPISELASLLASHLSLFPRSHNITAYPLDHQFLTAHRQWLAKFRAELSTLTGGRPRGQWLGKDGEAKWASWENDLRTVVELMEGKADRVMAEASDWREAVGAWGILVDVGLRRDDLPAATVRILDRIPADWTTLDDTIHSSLSSGDIVKALAGCQNLDTWLTAHLADVFDKLAMIPEEERFDMSLRDHFLLAYAEVLSEHPKQASLWRITAEYLNTAGDEGRSRLREFILHVALQGTGTTEAEEQDVEIVEDRSMDVEEGKIDSRFQHFAELRETCFDLKLEEEWKTISKIMADRLMRGGDYGIAATMLVQAEDGYGLSRLADKILEVYIRRGEEEFLRLVTSLPPTLLNDAPALLAADLKPDFSSQIGDHLVHAATSAFTSHLVSLSEFRDYLLFKTQGARDRAAVRLVSLLTTGIAPASLWAVLLVESIDLLEDDAILIGSDHTFELMRVLEDVTSNADFAPSDYLEQLAIYLGRVDGKDDSRGMTDETYAVALRKLEVVRLALARNLARAVIDIDDPF